VVHVPEQRRRRAAESISAPFKAAGAALALYCEKVTSVPPGYSHRTSSVSSISRLGSGSDPLPAVVLDGELPAHGGDGEGGVVAECPVDDSM
jgi:hypothetical protein